MKTLKLVSIFGDRLNLNGDQANLFILQQRLKWAGITSEVLTVSSQSELDSADADFLFIGHGSLAAWQSCLKDWPDLASAFLTSSRSVPAFAVASGADEVIGVTGNKRSKLAQTFSEFCVDQFEGRDLLGYKNTTTAENTTVRINQAMLTWLHGPVLAKNPAMADEIIRQILGGAEVAGLENENTRKIDEIVAGVWQLEKPQN